MLHSERRHVVHLFSLLNKHCTSTSSWCFISFRRLKMFHLFPPFQHCIGPDFFSSLWLNVSSTVQLCTIMQMLKSNHLQLHLHQTTFHQTNQTPHLSSLPLCISPRARWLVPVHLCASCEFLPALERLIQSACGTLKAFVSSCTSDRRHVGRGRTIDLVSRGRQTRSFYPKVAPRNGQKNGITSNHSKYNCRKPFSKSGGDLSLELTVLHSGLFWRERLIWEICGCVSGSVRIRLYSCGFCPSP